MIFFPKVPRFSGQKKAPGVTASLDEGSSRVNTVELWRFTVQAELMNIHILPSGRAGVDSRLTPTHIFNKAELLNDQIVYLIKVLVYKHVKFSLEC